MATSAEWRNYWVWVIRDCWINWSAMACS